MPHFFFNSFIFGEGSWGMFLFMWTQRWQLHKNKTHIQGTELTLKDNSTQLKIFHDLVYFMVDSKILFWGDHKSHRDQNVFSRSHLFQGQFNFTLLGQDWKQTSYFLNIRYTCWSLCGDICRMCIYSIYYFVIFSHHPPPQQHHHIATMRRTPVQGHHSDHPRYEHQQRGQGIFWHF